ncbi:hypothetical protein E5Q_04226 [Mixia osmundae IAM 14324]|uniref:Peroxisomal biogenesis factor 11 n=1 Tax=Mixia osmundae (strain CBS 9802 / IAM 14324 / JCM 22182 / KY 12970) TaxID=764103 RepID=G7E3Y8_MIXOS|nr:hypothetical protein E5Q_04226 [Mixia osmundae IAM 14324]
MGESQIHNAGRLKALTKMTVAHQVILHPFVSSTLKVWSTTVGRDKTYRTIQYFSRFLAWYCFRMGYTRPTIERFQNLKSALGLSRKLMRIGKPLEHLQSAIKAVDQRDPVLRVTAIGRQLGYAAYLVHDTLAWVHGAKVKVFDKDTISRINRNAARFWFFGLACSLLSGAYKMRDLRVKEIKARKPRPSPEKESERKNELRSIAAQRFAVQYQLVQDSLDILLPSASLNWLVLNDGQLGLAGFVTSIMGLRTQTQKVLGASK